MRRSLTNTKHDCKAGFEDALAWRGSGSSSLARVRVLVLLCALPPIFLCALCMTAPAFAATWPISASALSATLAFHQSYSAGNDSYVHSGIDIPASAGMQISSPLAGTVRFTGTVPSGDSRISTGAAARKTMNAVSIETLGGKTITLMPFDVVSVREGQAVSEGARLGTLAAGGDASSAGTHLHMGYKEGTSYLDPMLLFGAQPSAGQDATQEQASAAMVLWNGLLASQAPSAEAVPDGFAASSPDPQAQDAPHASLQEGAAGDLAAQAQLDSCGSIETGSFALKAKITSDTPFDAVAAAARSLGAACLAQARSLLEGFSALSQLTAVPLPVLMGLASILVVAGVVALGIVGVRFLAPRASRVLQATKRFLVFAGRGW